LGIIISGSRNYETICNRRENELKYFQ